MASFAYFEKVDEDDLVVRYRFGPEIADMPRTLTFDKETKRPSLADEESAGEDHQFLGTAMSIFRRFKEEETWPESGVHAA